MIKTRFFRTVLYLDVAGILLASACGALAQTAQDGSKRPIGPGNVFVDPALGGVIFGFDVDQNGSEGLLSEALTTGANCTYATETFDQTTGDIVKLVRDAESPDCGDDDVTWGVVGTSVGLVEHQHSVSFDHLQVTYQVLDPLEGNQFTGSWPAPGNERDEIWGVSRNQGTPLNAFQVLDLNNYLLYVFGSNVAQNAFGPVEQLVSTPFVIGLNTHTDIAFLSGGATGKSDQFGPPSIAEVELTSGKITTFEGVGSGTIQGLAVDSADNIACTTTYEDASVEFYDLTSESGFDEVLPGCTTAACSGFDVEFDPVHKLFLVAQPISSQVANVSTIYVYNTEGTLLETLNGFNFTTQRFDVLPVHIAIHPSNRSGFVDVTNSLGTGSLQSFTY